MQRFFFHSFPRPRRGEEKERQIQKGLLIAESLLQNGILLTPENYEIPILLGDGTIADRIQATQRRACFTELEPDGLSGHSEAFGPFALAYEIPTLRRLGALPVFYVPLESGGLLSLLATELLTGFVDVQRMVETLLSVRKHLSSGPTLKLDYRGRSVDFSADACDAIRFFIDVLMDATRADLAVTDSRLRATASCFYPTENPDYTAPLHYYMQREWRIVAGSFTFAGKEPTVKATPEQVANLLAIDKEFFSKSLRFYDQRFGVGYQELDSIGRRSHFLSSVGDVDVIGSARYLIHPNEYVLPGDLAAEWQSRGVAVVSERDFLIRTNSREESGSG